MLGDPRRSDAWRICFASKMPVFRNRRDEIVARRRRVRDDEETRIWFSSIERGVDAAGPEQLLAGAHREDRLAMTILVLDELESAPVSA